MDNAIHTTLAFTWFGLIGLMLAFYVVTDGFDLGIGILSLLRTRRDDHDVMVQSIGHVWDARFSGRSPKPMRGFCRICTCRSWRSSQV
jgi:hypothetical protein